MDWCLYGDDKRKEMDRDLKPEYLLDDLRRYQDVFGEEFGVKELLMLEDIRVKAMIAGALADMPEFLIDQIGKASNSSNFPSMTRAMERIADVVGCCCQSAGMDAVSKYCIQAVPVHFSGTALDLCTASGSNSRGIHGNLEPEDVPMD